MHGSSNKAPKRNMHKAHKKISTLRKKSPPSSKTLNLHLSNDPSLHYSSLSIPVSPRRATSSSPIHTQRPNPPTHAQTPVTTPRHHFHSTTPAYARQMRRFVPPTGTSTAQQPQTARGSALSDPESPSAPSYFFNEQPDNLSLLEQRMKVKSHDRQVALESVKQFMGADPEKIGMTRSQQSQFAGTLLEEMEAHRQLQDADEFDLAPEVSEEVMLRQQMREFDDLPLETFLKDTGFANPKGLIKTIGQRDKAQRRYNLRTQQMTGIYSQDPQQQQQQQQEEEYQLDENMLSFLEQLSPEELKRLIDPSSPDYNPILQNTLTTLHEQVDDETKSQEHRLESVADIARNYATSQGKSGKAAAALAPTVGEHGELIFDHDSLQSEAQLSAFQEHQDALSKDPTVFKYVDDDFEYYIPPGMSIQKLVKMSVPTHHILNYARKQIADAQLESNYVGVSLQQLNLKFQLENQKRIEQGLEPIVLTEYKRTKFDDLDLTGVPEADVNDLHAYFSHFEHLRRLQKLEKMKDNPGFDPHDPDWQDDEDDYEIDADGVMKSTKISTSLLKKKKVLIEMKEAEKKAVMKKMAEQSGYTLEEFQKQQQFLEEQGFASDPEAIDPDDWALLDQARKAKMVGNQLVTREAQYPDHKPTIKALQTFVRTVPLDEPIPRELQRRLNLMLTDADYVKRKDYHFMMNDVEVWYLANRLPVVYSILRRVLVEIRQRIPAWKPERVLEFAAGGSPGLWAARDVYYQDLAEYTAVERDGRLALLGQQLTADLGIHIYYRSRLLVNSEGQMEVSLEDDARRDKKRAKLTHKQKKVMDKEDKQRKERHLREMSKKHSLVISPYALSKQPNKEYRRLLLESLWDQVDPNGGLLVIIESTEADASGFNVVRECRDYLLKKYPKHVQIQEDSGDKTGRIVDSETKKQLITPIVHVEESLSAEGQAASTADGSVPTWAQGATKKVETEEAKNRKGTPQDPGASSILPCSHDRPCPMGAMLKLNDEVKKLKKLAAEEQLSISLPQIPIKSCMFGQRMLRAPMPNQSPLQDIEVPQFLGDAIIENFSYIVLRRGDIPVVTEDKLELEQYESRNVARGKLNLPGGLSREEYQQLKEEQRQQDEEDFNLLYQAYENDPSFIEGLDTDLRTRLIQHRKKLQHDIEEAEIGSFLDGTGDEYDQMQEQVDGGNDIEARRLAMNIFGAKSVENEETLESFDEEMFSKLPGMKKPELPANRKQRKKLREQQAANPHSLNNRFQAIKTTNQPDVLDGYDLDVIEKELGYKLDAEGLDNLREVITKMEQDRPLLNPKKEFNINRWARILSPPLKRGGHVVFDLCTPDGNFERRVVGREGVGNLGFKQARLSKWGDIWPYQRPMSLKEMKAEQEMQALADENIFAQVRTSGEANEKLREIRNLFSTTYSTETIQNIDHFQNRLDSMELAGDSARLSKKEKKRAAKEEAQRFAELTFDNMDELDSETTNKQLAQLRETTKLRQAHEERNLQTRLRQQRMEARDKTPNEFNDINLFNDPSYYEAIPGFDQYAGDIPEGTPGTIKIGGHVVPIEQPGEKEFQTALAAQKLMEDLQALPPEQQELLGPDAQKALKKMGENLSQNQRIHLAQRRHDAIASGQLGIQTPGQSTDRTLEELHTLVESVGNNAEGGSLLAKLRTQADIQRAYDERMARRRASAEFIDDIYGTEEEGETGKPQEAVPVPTSLSRGVKVDDIIHSVEQKISALQDQKKRRVKMNKKQAKIALKRREKELIAEGLSPSQATIKACEELDLSIPENVQKGGKEDDQAPEFNPMDDFIKLMGQNVEFDDSVLNYQKIRKQQDRELAKFDRKNALDDIDDDDDDDDDDDKHRDPEDSDFSSYDEHEDVELGASDYSDGEILHKPRQLGQSETEEDAPYTGPIDDIDMAQLSRGKWAASNSKLATTDNKKRAQASMKAKLLDILSAQQTDELQSLLDDPELKQYDEKEKEMKKDRYNKQQQSLYEGLSRTERKAIQAKQKLKKEYLFSDDEDWDLNEKDNLVKTPDVKPKPPPKDEFVHNDLEHTQPLSTTQQHALQGAALDIVDHSYRVLPSVLKEKMSVPFTGKRSFAENMDLLDQYENQEIPAQSRNARKSGHQSGNRQSFVDVTAKKRGDKGLPKDIHGFRGKNSNRSSFDRHDSKRQAYEKKSRNNRDDSFSPQNYGMGSSSKPKSRSSGSRRGFATFARNSIVPLGTNTALSTTKSAISNLFRSTRPTLSKKGGVLLTMPGQNIPTSSASGTKVVQISTRNQTKLNPSRDVYNTALGTKRLDYSKPNATSMYNTILTPFPSVDLTLSEQTIPIETSAASALHRDNTAQAEAVSIAGIFRFDGPQPMSTYGLAKSKEMARKLQELAGIKTSSKLDHYRTPPRPGTESPFIDNSAPPMTFDPVKEDVVNQELTSKVLGHDIYVNEVDLRQQRYKPQYSELPGMTFRDGPARDVNELGHEIDLDPEGDEFQTYARDMYIHQQDRSETRRDASGRELKGRLKSQTPGGESLNQFRSESDMHQRKAASRKKRTEFGQQIEKARYIASQLSGKEYIPRADVKMTTEHGAPRFAKAGKRSVAESAANLLPKALQGGSGRSAPIDLKSVDLGQADAPAPFYKSRETALQREIDEVKQLRRERQRKMLTPLSLQDDIPRDPEGKPMDTVKTQPSPWAKTVSEKRASMAVIENPDEAEVRQHREKLGLDYSYTALLTNQDGFGPKMGPDGKFIEKQTVPPNELITIEELEDLVRYSDPKDRKSLAKALKHAHTELLTNKQLQQDNKELIKSGKVKQIPFKILLQPKQPSQDTKLLTPSPQPSTKQSFEYNIRPLNSQELALLHAEHTSALQQPDLRKDVETLLHKHQEGLTFKQKQSIISEDVDQQVKLSMSTSQLGQLARRFTQMAKKQEDRELLKGDSESEFAFEPPQIPTMQSSWGVKNRTPERPVAATAAADHFVRQQRKFDKLIAEVQEVELLDRLRGSSMKIPEAIVNKNVNDGPFNSMEDKLAKDMLIKKGIKTQKQIDLEELRQAIEFEKGMQQAVDENYGEAKKQLKHKLQKMARDGEINPGQFIEGSNKGLLFEKSLDEQINDRLESQKATQKQLTQQQSAKTSKFFLNGTKPAPASLLNQQSPKFQKLTQFDPAADATLSNFQEAEIVESFSKKAQKSKFKK